MSAASGTAPGRARATSHRLRPTWRLGELALLALGAALGVTAAAHVPLHAGSALTWANLAPTLALAALFLAVHVSLVLRGHRGDPTFLPIVQALMLISLAVMARLAVGLEAPGLDARHGRWLALGVVTLAAVVHVPWDLQLLRRYRYTWLLLGLALVAVTFLFGRAADAGSPRLWLGLPGLSFQPSEVLKLVVIIYLAAYLSEKQDILVGATTRLGRLSLPPLPYLAPVVLMLGLSLGLLAAQRDLGAALLLFVIALGLVYAASGRLALVLAGLAMFLVGAWFLNDHVAVVSTRTAIWLDPWADAQGRGYQLVQSLLAVGAGGVLGTGLGYGLPTAIPAVHTDFVYAAVAEELGLAGASAVLALYLVLVSRGFRAALRTGDPFERLLATGLSFAFAVQVFIIVGGVLKVIPLTGITLPFLSYGGTSLVTSAIAVGLLLRISADSP